VAPDADPKWVSGRADARASTDTSSRANKYGSRDEAVVWVEQQQFVRPVEVQAGLSDGLYTEIVAGALCEGDRIVVGEVLPEAPATQSPFAPGMFKGLER
jgi:HlyD family secretion protein